MSAQFPEDLRYTKEHEWVRLEGDVATIGITHFAQSSLGDIVFVELPSEGDVLEQEEAFGSVEAVKAVSDLYAPVAGEVIEVNERLDADPAVINGSPYEDGWMVRIQVSDPSEVEELMEPEQYHEFVAGLEEGE